MDPEPHSDSTIPVLLVDDREENLIALRATLDGLPGEYVSARSGAEALRLVLERDFAVIVLDVDMPEMDGFETAELIRQRDRSRHTPIIFLTAYDIGPRQVFRGYLVGAVDYLIKPYAAEVLRTKVAVFCDLFRTTRELQSQLAETRRLNHELDHANRQLLQSRQALQRAHDLLEQRVEQRTAELVTANQALALENAERIRAEERIRTSLREKEVLLREVHHRVKNNLQVISSLLNWQKDYVTDDQVVGQFEECQGRIQTMALIHERLYESQDFARVDLAEYTRGLVSNLQALYGRSRSIALLVEAENVFLGIDTAIPCGLIINELVSNCFKHAFPVGQEGEIRIEFHPLDAAHYELVVLDNGIGLPKDVDLARVESLGWQVVRVLAEQLDATLSIEHNGGTRVRIVFPKP